MLENNTRQYIGIATTAIEHNNDKILEVHIPELLPCKMGKMGTNSQDTESKNKQHVTIESLSGGSENATIKTQ